MRKLLFCLVWFLEIWQGAALLSFRSPSRVTPVNCVWTAFGAWSECDGCTKTQTRRRSIEVYAQFEGLECSGSAYETQTCHPTRGCPIEDGCGDRFRCTSGQCISKALVCNGDHDCEEDSYDEANCDVRAKVCDTDKYAPNTEKTGLGFDIITRKPKSSVIHTKSFGGQCRKVFSGDSREFFRLSDNVLTYTFKVQAKNDFSYDFYESKWSYAKDTERRVRSDYGERSDDTDSQTYTHDKSYQYMVIRNHVEVAQFINRDPEFLVLAEPFWRELFSLPSVYEYSSYRKFIDRYGTHFRKSGSLGGTYEFQFYLETEKITKNGMTMSDMQKCTSTSVDLLFVKYSSTECKHLYEAIKSSSGSGDKEVRGKATVTGGEPKFVTALSYFSMDNPVANDERYAAWAGSVTNLPSVIKQKLVPLYELVKEVPCASVKRIFLKRAIEEYMAEDNSCRCKPCRNKGVPAVVDTKCVCNCKLSTYGSACEFGSLVNDDAGVIDGNWGCWSPWNACRGTSGRRVRSRVCNNPAPSGGGLRCIGDSIESLLCEQDELEHLRTVEPHCFDIQILPTEFCGSPPPLENGYVQDDDSSYHVGKRIVYTCRNGYTLVGNPVAECKGDHQWHGVDMKCQRLLCSRPDLSEHLSIAPVKYSYQIGDKITLSCPPDLQLDGPAVTLCSSSLTWNPNVKNIQCTKNTATPAPKVKIPKCKPWEKLVDSQCACKMAYECGSSLPVCAVDRKSKNVALTICKLHALECAGWQYPVTEEANCKFPDSTGRSCDECHLWETCSGKTGPCVCREVGTCEDEGISICVLVDGGKQTMSECDAGILKCQGKNVAIVSKSPCDV
ncbi:complement component C7 [Pseudophryne corroboree]|uniref:complement component C7 n=1 Tax=Pseudophryne corroboree TaxID=495146 RepID=UPI0030818392